MLPLNTEYLKGAYKDSFSFHPTTPDEIVNVVKLMKPKKSSGYDDITVDIMNV